MSRGRVRGTEGGWRRWELGASRHVARLGLALALGVGGACGGSGSEPTLDAVVGPTHQHIVSRDGVLAVDLPVDLVVHTHAASIFGTSALGERRVYLRHLPHDTLIRVAGHTKDALIARGWEIDAERHYDRAIEVKAVRRLGGERRARVSWFIARGGRVLLCEGFDLASRQAELEATLRPLCQRVAVTPAPEPAPP